MFRLARLEGGDLALEEYRGRQVLLVFSDPQCGPCDQLAPHLERLHHERRDLQVLMVSRQDVETNRQKVAKLGLTFPVVLQKSWEISLLYGMFATPVGYLIDEQGVLASDVAVGVEPIWRWPPAERLHQRPTAQPACAPGARLRNPFTRANLRNPDYPQPKGSGQKATPRTSHENPTRKSKRPPKPLR